MTKRYTLYQIDTGRILSCPTCVNVQLPPQGPTGDGDTGVLHATSDPKTQRVEHGRIVPKGAMARAQQNAAFGWFKVRKKKNALLSRTDHKTLPDYPMSEAARARLYDQRKQTREIMTATTDPVVADQMLDTIWSEDDAL